MLRWITICVMGYLLTGCLETEVSLSGSDYQIIDSLYTKQRDSLTSILESECIDFRDSVLQIWVDSIVLQRQAEIEKLIGQ